MKTVQDILLTILAFAAGAALIAIGYTVWQALYTLMRT